MDFIQIHTNKKDYLELLLIGDEQEDLIDKYLERGDMFLLSDNGAKAVCVITDESGGVFEIKNIAVAPKYQHMGYGKKMIEFICSHYKDKLKELILGTGDSILTVPFYEHCGFFKTHRIKNFFIDNYDHPIFEAGKQLVDMVYMKKIVNH